MLRKGDKVMHIRHPEWDVGIVAGEKFPGILVFFPDENKYQVWTRKWICAPGHLYKVNGFSKEEIRKQAAIFEEIIRLRQIEEARRTLEG